MGCGGDFQQVRLGEMIEFTWDSSGNLQTSALDLSDAIDLGGANVVAVSITPCKVSLGSGVTGVDFNFMTAPINSKSFYADVKDGGSTVAATITGDGAVFERGEGFSRFFALMPADTVNGTATTSTEITATIDVVVRT